MSEKKIIFQKDDLIFTPIGGSGEIGMNLNVYHYQGKWIIVDLGVGFAGDSMPGIDMMVPDISYIEARKKDLLAIVVTHAHEDHLGAIQYVWERLKVPIYGTKFTLNFLQSKLREYSFCSDVEMIELEENSDFNIGPFLFEMVHLTHSIPEMSAFLIKCGEKRILHTGDWKFDEAPVIGQNVDFGRLAEIGKKGVDVMICDSTNVFNKGHSGSEGKLVESLFEIINEAQGMILVTTFASNVGRLKTIHDVATKAGKVVVVTGRSLCRVISVAKESGYLEEGYQFFYEDHLKNFKRDEIVVLCTGCQGEERAAVNKIVSGKHRKIKILPNDTIIFSSKIIPGNDKKIFKLLNALSRKSVNVITEKDHLVHVSGHPYQEELARMYHLIKPKVAIPVHGEHFHMSYHAKFAKEQGVPSSIIVTDGDIIKIGVGTAKIIGHEPVSAIGIEGTKFLAEDGRELNDRRKVMQSGMIIVSIILDKAGGLELPPKIEFIAAINPAENKDLIQLLEKEVAYIIKQVRLEKLGKQNSFFTKKVKNISKEKKSLLTNVIEGRVSKAIRKIYKNDVGKEILVKILVQYV